jgi:uncharacterized SAM-binding protein YcdF (DUF218 family)
MACWKKVTLSLLIVAGLFALWFVNAGRLLAAPATEPVKADLIVVLGGDTGERARTGADLFRAGYAPNVLLTGFAYVSGGRPALLQDWRVRRLVHYGVPEDSIRIDYRSLTTLDEAVNTLDLMKKNGWRRALVVSDPPHLRRLAWLWDRAFDGSGFEYQLVPTQPDWWAPGNWWDNERSAVFVLMEHIKLTYYLFNP